MAILFFPFPSKDLKFVIFSLISYYIYDYRLYTYTLRCTSARENCWRCYDLGSSDLQPTTLTNNMPSLSYSCPFASINVYSSATNIKIYSIHAYHTLYWQYHQVSPISCRKHLEDSLMILATYFQPWRKLIWSRLFSSKKCPTFFSHIFFPRKGKLLIDCMYSVFLWIPH